MWLLNNSSYEEISEMLLLMGFGRTLNIFLDDLNVCGCKQGHCWIFYMVWNFLASNQSVHLKSLHLLN